MQTDVGTWDSLPREFGSAGTSIPASASQTRERKYSHFKAPSLWYSVPEAAGNHANLRERDVIGQRCPDSSGHTHGPFVFDGLS